MSFAQHQTYPSTPTTRSATSSDLENLAGTAETSSLLPRRSQSASTFGRLPFHYDAENTESREDLASRYRYYQRLDPHSNSQMRMPHHVAPANFFSIIPFGDGTSKQGSLVTIFSIWNAMVGSALLTMPWALNQAGFFLGLFFFLVMPLFAFYTAYLIIKIPQGMKLEGHIDFHDICRHFWGKRMEKFSAWFSVLVWFGGVIVYWVLMSNFLFGTGIVIHDSISPVFGERPVQNLYNNSMCGVVCAGDARAAGQSATDNGFFHHAWQLKTVPVYLALIVLPLLMFKDATFFQKFNGAGTISVIYILVYVLVKAFNCGIHLDFSNEKAVDYAKPADNHFWSLTGTLSMSLFLHNSILSIMQHQRNPENNVRDLSWAFVLTSITYLVVGVAFYVTFPLAKDCISDNLLNNYLPSDMLSSVARLFLLFQILTVFSLFSFLIRMQVLTALLGIENPKKRWVLLLNMGILAICTFFAIVLPSVGNIIRFGGAFTGLVYMFILPCAAYLKKLQMNDTLTTKDIVIHALIVLLGIINCIGQFLIF